MNDQATAASKQCGVRGCPRPAAFWISGYDRLTGEPLPTGNACDEKEHQYAVTRAILPFEQLIHGTGPKASFGGIE